MSLDYWTLLPGVAAHDTGLRCSCQRWLRLLDTATGSCSTGYRAQVQLPALAQRYWTLLPGVAADDNGLRCSCQRWLRLLNTATGSGSPGYRTGLKCSCQRWLRLLNTATGSGSPGYRTGLRCSCQCWLRLLDTALKDAILVNLLILGLGSSDGLGCGSFSENPRVTLV